MRYTTDIKRLPERRFNIELTDNQRVKVSPNYILKYISKPCIYLYDNQVFLPRTINLYFNRGLPVPMANQKTLILRPLWYILIAWSQAMVKYIYIYGVYILSTISRGVPLGQNKKRRICDG